MRESKGNRERKERADRDRGKDKGDKGKKTGRKKR